MKQTELRSRLPVLGLFFFCAAARGAEWVQAGGNLPAPVTKVIVAPSGRFFALAENALYSSSDRGGSWFWFREKLNSAGSTPHSLVATEAEVFVAVSKIDSTGGVYRYSLVDRSWTLGFTGLPADRSVRGLAHLGTALLVGTSQGVYASRDAGASWSAVNQGLPTETTVSLIHAFGTTLFIATNLGTSYRGLPAGNSWSWTDNLVRYPFSMAALGDHLFSASIESLRRSTDSGISWQLKVAGMPLDSNGFAPDGMPKQVVALGNQVFASTDFSTAQPPYSEVWRSFDYGESWQRFGTGLPQNAVITTLFSDGTALYASFSRGAVWKIVPDGVSTRPQAPKARTAPRHHFRSGYAAPGREARGRFSTAGRRLPASVPRTSHPR